MNLNDKIGFKVTNKAGVKGTIVKYDGRYITIAFGAIEKTYDGNGFIDGYLTFEDSVSQSEVEAEIRGKEERWRIAQEEAAKAAEEADRRRKVEEEECRRKAEEAERERRSAEIDSKFGRDYHVEHLKRRPILTYQEVEDQFGIKISGFGRGINPTESSIVLISSIGIENGSFVYHDHWDENGDYIYSGEGQIGDMRMTGRNEAIKDAAKNGKTLYLFVKFSSTEYYFQGRFVCIDIKYEDDKDKNGDLRREIKFRLRKIDE